MLHKIQFLNKPFDISRIIFIFMKLESFAIYFPHVLMQQQRSEVFFKGLQLKVFLAAVVRNDGDSIVELADVGMSCIVN